MTETEQLASKFAALLDILPPDQRMVLARRAVASLQPEQRQELLTPTPETKRPYGARRGPRDPLAVPHTSQSDRRRHRSGHHKHDTTAA